MSRKVYIGGCRLRLHHKLDKSSKVSVSMQVTFGCSLNIIFLISYFPIFLLQKPISLEFYDLVGSAGLHVVDRSDYLDRKGNDTHIRNICNKNRSSPLILLYQNPGTISLYILH